jgi:hypothetical protein
MCDDLLTSVGPWYSVIVELLERGGHRFGCDVAEQIRLTGYLSPRQMAVLDELASEALSRATCRRCHRALTDATSVLLGIGPECRRY